MLIHRSSAYLIKMKILLIILSFLALIYTVYAVFSVNSFKNKDFLQRNAYRNESNTTDSPNYVTSNEIPIVINTWPFTEAGIKAWEILSEGGSALDAVEQGCSLCEELQCDGTVGYGGSPDENGETTLDAMIMDGETHDVGAVGSLRKIKSAISVARHVMEHTQHTLLVGSQATDFALMMGFQEQNLTTSHSESLYNDWELAECQPNFWKNVIPDPTTSCGPYAPVDVVYERKNKKKSIKANTFGNHNHDTIGMVAIDSLGKIACGTSTNGANHKIPGRVGDSPIPGSGAYVDKAIGGAAATGDGDVMMRFMPSLIAVEGLRAGFSPEAAATMALQRITQYYSSFSGAVIVLTIGGEYGAACNNLYNGVFNFTVGNAADGVHLQSVSCIDSVIFNEKISKTE